MGINFNFVGTLEKWRIGADNKPCFQIKGADYVIIPLEYFTGTPIKTAAFGGAGNSRTSLSNYGDIPADWK